MNYAEAKARADELDAAARAAGAVLQAFPRNPWGLVTDVTFKSPEYQAAKRAFNKAFEASREFNAWYVKEFREERAAERAGRRPA